MKAIKAYKGPKGIAKVYHDETPANPWKDWEGNVPLIVEGGRNFCSHDYGDVEEAIWSALGKLDTADLERIAALLDGGADLIAEAKEYDEDLGDAIHNHVNNVTVVDRLDQLAAICSGLGWPALSTGSSGYSQGDYVDLLAVWTPEFGRTGRCGGSDRGRCGRILAGASEREVGRPGASREPGSRPEDDAMSGSMGAERPPSGERYPGPCQTRRSPQPLMAGRNTKHQ